MKRLLCILLLMLALSLPTFGGHTVAGDHYCSCNTPGCIQDYPCECCNLPVGTDNAPKGVPAEWGIVLVGLLLWLRLKA